MPECRAPDCDQDLGVIEREITKDGYCCEPCRQVAMMEMSERMDAGDVTEPVPDDHVAEIREYVERHYHEMKGDLT